LKQVCSGALNNHQTMMGNGQEEWLDAGLAQSHARWNVLAQQVLMAEINWNPNHQPVLENMDKWDGYHAGRDRLLNRITTRKPANPIVLSGDIHSNWVNELKADFQDAKSPVLATEFVGTSITSGGDRPDKHGDAAKWLPNNPHVKFYNNQRGYVLCGVNEQRWQTDFRVLDYVTREGSPIRTKASFVVQAGDPSPHAI
jgi:alkaline phosphatase D